MSRASAGPFTAGKCQVGENLEPGEYDGAAVFEASGQPFCLIPDDLAVGGRPGAIARAQRIAESLNSQGGHAYIDENGALRAPPGFGFVAKGDGVEMVPLISVTVAGPL